MALVEVIVNFLHQDFIEQIMQGILEMIFLTTDLPGLFYRFSSYILGGT